MTKNNFQAPKKLSQRGRIAFLLRDSILYGGATAVSKAISLITFPLLVHHFSVTDYGVLDYFLILAGLLTIFFIFGQDSAIARYFYEYEDTQKRRQLISQSLVFQLAIMAVLLPLLWLSADWLTGFLIKIPDRVQLFKLVLLQLPFLLLINCAQNLLKWTFQRSCFLILSLGCTTINAILLVTGILVFDIDISSVLIINLTVSMIFSGLGLFFIRKWLTRPENFRHLSDMLPFAIPYGVISIAGAFSPTLERTLTDHLLGAEQLGLYAAATKIAMLISLLVNAFQTAWGPFALSLYKQADAGQTYNQVLKLFVISACPAALFITLLAQPLIQTIASDSYSGSIVVVFPLAMGLVIQGTSWITEIGINLSKRTHLVLYAHLIAFVTTLASIWFLTLLLGLLGVGLGVLLGLIARTLVASRLAQYAHSLPWCYTPVIALIALTLVTGLISIWVRETVSITAGNTSLSISMICIFTISWYFILSQAERDEVIEAIRTRLAGCLHNAV